MFLVFKNTKISNNCTLLSHNNLFFGVVRNYTLFFLIRLNSNPRPLCKVGGDPAMINQNHLILLSFGKREDTGWEGIILGDNLAEHCTNFLKQVMIVKLKFCFAGKLFGKFVFKNYQRYLFSKYVVCDQESNGVRHEGKS